MTYRRKTGSLHAATWAGAVVLMSDTLAVAQATGQPVERESGWLTWVVAGGIIGVVCLTGFLNAKRSHLH